MRKARSHDPSPRAMRFKARALATKAVRDGFLKPLPCRCGEPEAQMHHADYSKPLEVEWLCAPCHADEHRRLGMGPKNKVDRRLRVPVVRVPGFNHQELRLIDRCARAARVSRAAWIRLVALSVAQDGVQVNLTRASIKHGARAPSAAPKTAFEATANHPLRGLAKAVLPASLTRTYDPDA